MKFAISPDENPGDPGAVHNGIVERDVNVAVASQLQAALQRCGQEAAFDPSITYEQRVAEANANGTQVLVACAHNAAAPAAEGALFIFCGAEAHQLGRQQLAAEKVGEALVAGGLVAHFGTYDEQVYECCAFNGDTVYCELGYETNAQDAATIKQPDYPHRAAELIAQGLAAAYGFTYAPVVHPSAPEPEWKQNLEKLPAPVSGELAAPVEVIDTLNNQNVAELAAGTQLSVSYATKVRNIDYYMTDFSVEHATGYAIAKASVTFASAPEPAPVPPPAPEPPQAPPPAPQPTPEPSAPPAAAPPAPESLEERLVGLADHELIAFLEAVVAEFRKRVHV